MKYARTLPLGLLAAIGLAWLGSRLTASAEPLPKASGPVFKVIDYGARMNCAAKLDDTAAWQAAIKAALVAGGEVEMPAGCSMVDSLSVVATSFAIHIHGQGAQVSKVIAKSTGSTPFTLSGSNMRLSGIGFDSTSHQTGGSYVHVTAVADGVEIDHFTMQNGYIPLQIDGGVIEHVHDGIFGATRGPATIEIKGGNDQYLDHLLSDNPPSAQPNYGIWVSGSQAVWMDTVDVLHSNDALAFATLPGAGGSPITWAFIQNSAFDSSSGCGIHVDAAAGTSIRGLNFTDTWSSTNKAGVCTSGAGIIDGLSFVNHRSFNNTHQGFVFAAGTNIAIDGGSQISGNGGAASGTMPGVEIGAGVSGVALRNARIGQMAGFANVQGYGIMLDAGPGNHIAIQNNDLRGFTQHAIADHATGADQVISGNLGDDGVPGPALLAVGASPFTYAAGAYGQTAYVYGGTVSRISVGGVVLATSAPAQISLRPGQSMTVTYSTAPSIAINGQ